MALALGTATPSTVYLGSTQATAMYLGGTLVYSSAPAAWQTLYNDDFTTLKTAVWTKATTYPTTGTVTLVSGKMRVSTASTTAWAPGASVFLGDPNKPQGDTTTGAPGLVSDAEYYFDYTLSTITAEHYPSIMFRGRNAEMWQGGDGGNLPMTGYVLVLGVAPGGVAANSFLDLGQGYNAGVAASIVTQNFVFPNAAMKFHIKIVDNMLYIRIWAASTTEAAAFPTNGWTLSGPYVADQSDGSLGFGMANGPAAVIKYVDIDNLVSTTPTLSLGATTQAPTSDPAGFNRIVTENFSTPAIVGTGATGFVPLYANSFQPYDDGGTTWPRQMITAHDSVMDIAMDGTRGSGGFFGSPTNAANRIGGRFTMRAKALGATNNGPAFMIWPTSDAWVEGELDFPESVSGGLAGFQDSPWIHHHTMDTSHPEDQSAAQDVPLLVSWRDWHVYSLEWYPPGKGPNPTTGLVIYYIDEVEVYRTTTDVPKTNHRFTYQVGNYGNPGNLYIDWVTISELAS